MSPAARCLAEDGARRIVIRGCSSRDPHPSAETLLVPREAAEQGEPIDPNRIVAALFALGMKKILVEGGSMTVSSFIDAGAVDRLHVLVAPVILGSGVSGLSLKPIDRMTEAHRPMTSVHVLDDGDVLFDCDLRHRDQG
jgi:riboflavin biosynthesis pyrimidine reductase